ncbi:hypothetical protein MFIFM68171_02647 [Madurella fahalii]|uniref:AAA+ ATPase domain-containing protein n=1 Tax=Madurella fahalii TaxID=1157608 RepID=A0ABQ0G3W6_9PEZI
MSDPEQKGPIRAQEGESLLTVPETDTFEAAPSNSSSSSDSNLPRPTPLSSTDPHRRATSLLKPSTQDRVDNHETKTSISTATLYCPENGFPHSNLLCFGIMKCPSCSQNLARVGPPPKASCCGRNGEDGNSPGSKGTDPDNCEVHQDKDINNDAQPDDEAETEEDEEDEMCKIPETPQETVFNTITVLHTTVPADSARTFFEVNRLLAEGPIIGNPQISVAVKYTKINIMSSLFIDALKSVLSYDTQDKLESGNLDLNEPFCIIGHHLERLEKYTQQVDNADSTKTIANGTGEGIAAAGSADETGSVARETRIHVRLVLSFVSKILKDPITKERERYARKEPVCTFRMMWYLFRPGDPVYVRSDEAEDAYVVDSVEMEKFSLSSTDVNCGCIINLWYLDFNGQYISRARHKAYIRPFKGERRITSLSVVPYQIWDQSDSGSLRTSLEERGRKWVDHLMGKQVEYRGEPFNPGRKNDCAFINPTSNIAACDCSDCTEARKKQSKLLHTPEVTYDSLSVKNIGNFVDDSGRRIAYMLCSRKLKGFVFGTRVWETLDIRYCHPVKPDKNPFGRLVMPNERKMMIKALVYKYTDPEYAGGSSQVWGADFIKNKGEGLVFLLHGGPGVGKTFTAECIAAFAGRPLLALTCGDIGTEEVQIELKLRYWLQLAHKWGAVMLIDEADVFLERCQDGDLKRNSLVSIFLREIEYYQGILFLTSNRVGKFDDAIVSRIHVIVHYQGLDDEYREKIWNQFFDKLEKERGSTMRIEKSARRYVLENKRMAQMNWNGREIRNAFQTAVALAEYRFHTKPKSEKAEGDIATLEEEDFKQICDMTIKFKQYLAEVYEGSDEEARAAADKARV